MNKKGELTMKKTIEVVLAIIVIAGLVYLGAKLYSLSQGKNEMAIAESHLNQIMNKINSLDDGGEPEDYVLYSPRGWVLIAWPTDYQHVPEQRWIDYATFWMPKTRVIFLPYDKNDFPNYCRANEWEKCLCLCNTPSSNLLNGCNTQSICRELNFEEVEFNKGSIRENYQRPIVIHDLVENDQKLKFELNDNKLKVTAIKE